MAVQCPAFGVAASTAYNFKRCRCDVCREAKRARALKSALSDPERFAATSKRASAAYRARHPDKRRETERAGYLRHLDKRKLKTRLWYQANRERALEYCREYRQRPEVRERNRAQNREWRANNRERARDFNRRRAARRASAPGVHSLEQLLARIAFYGWRCYVCRAPYGEVDHVIPLSRGGGEWPANLRPICRSCNARKNDRKPGEWRP